MSDDPTPEKPKRAKSRVPASGEKKRKTRRDRLEYHGIEKPPYLKERKPRRKKVGRPRKYRDDPYRLSPAYRATVRWKTVIMPEEAYMQLKEIATFYKLSISKMVASLIEPAFQKAYEESMTLARIEANREKEKERVEKLKRQTSETETPDDSDAPRRTHF
jgi:hypothetical protein